VPLPPSYFEAQRRVSRDYAAMVEAVPFAASPVAPALKKLPWTSEPMSAEDLREMFAPIRAEGDSSIDRVARAVASLNTWLEPRIAEAWSLGMDFAVTRTTRPGEDGPLFNRETMGWETSFSWSAGAIPAGTIMGPQWTVYRCPEDWPELVG
jgi:hypothetical protein